VEAKMATKDPEKRREQWNAWYQRNKSDPSYKQKIREFDKDRRKKLVEWFNETKSGLECKRCGFSHPAALDFHHRNPEEKLYEVSVMPFRSISKKKILEEMDKCDVYCANCHRILHWEEKKE
jgi:hypothetical protein